MTSAELLRRIHVEIGIDWDRSNLHGCNLRDCLVTPVKRPYEDAMDSTKTVELWLVLEEIPGDPGGYQIVFDEATGSFGLACQFTSGRDGYLGPYGDTFFDAFDAM